MKAWERLYEKEVLTEAKKLVDNVEIISNDEGEIIAQIDGFKVETYIMYNSPSHTSCNCSLRCTCKHEAAVVYYLKNHPELYLKDNDFEEVFNLVSENDFKEFLLDEFKNNPDLKDRFLKRFTDDYIDKDYYSNKLDDIFKIGEGRDFEYHGYHDLDFMEDSLQNFLFYDISNVLSAGEYDFAFDLLIKIAKLLNDELISTFDSWYGLVDIFMEHVNVLEFSIYLDSEKLDELYANMNHIMNRF